SILPAEWQDPERVAAALLLVPKAVRAPRCQVEGDRAHRAKHKDDRRWGGLLPKNLVLWCGEEPVPSQCWQDYQSCQMAGAPRVLGWRRARGPALASIRATVSRHLDPG